ncbi:NUDIX hydrolase [Phaeobacter sp. 22II1-1F12B]|uniref:NUDIX hydrolase n=1 Tax=Phaeobacter sp. 22II1-1F12B TaxID=1317111 RepID=UPI000B52576E|nr:NUDIX hydrolase [Phaeobacter sp. 22II1-1F12B]OWU82560.1 NUDIX hydrolase [Phaeobacter sp. 22II1-1F12B]
MIRRFGQPPLNGRKYTRRPGAYALLPHGGQFLVTHQSEPHPEIQLPGGGIDPGESAITALHREVLEETGWHIATPRKMGIFRRFVFMPEYDIWAEKICHIFIARPVARMGMPSEPAHEAVWLPFSEAIELLANDGDQHFAAEFTRRYG